MDAHTASCDAIVVGAGPNGLVAANALADAGWDVIVLEAQAEVGGAVRSSEVTAPGFTNDLFSAFYPLAAASPLIRDLDLEMIRQVRNAWQFYRDRRPDSYTAIPKP